MKVFSPKFSIFVQKFPHKMIFQQFSQSPKTGGDNCFAPAMVPHKLIVQQNLLHISSLSAN